MAGRTSEKGNTTGKTIFCFIGKVIGAGITAFAILALFCVFYYNPPVHEPCGNGVTSYVRQADTFWARGTEGFAMGTTDDSGYNNSYPADGRKTAILMMGSSQTEGLYVNEDDCVSYLLNEKYAEDGSNRYVYNVGMSAHTIYRNISNLENALKVYRPAEYVALETGTLAMNPEILVLDEPTAGLDPEGRDKILQCISDLRENRGIGVVLVSHSMEDVARYVERLIVMNHGTVAFDATPGEVFSHYKELEKIGLMAPQVTYVMEGLARRGVTLPHNAITVQEAVDSILQAR